MIGHSFGGVFASWLALNHPNIFQNYLVISPIFHYEDGRIFDENFDLQKTTSAKIYLAAGGCENFHPDFFVNLTRFQSELGALPNVATKLEIFDGQYHCSNVPMAISQGLRFVFC